MRGEYAFSFKHIATIESLHGGSKNTNGAANGKARGKAKGKAREVSAKTKKSKENGEATISIRKI
jgi:hypothetical protein